MSLVTVHSLSMLSSASVTIPAMTAGSSANFTWEGLPASELVVIDWGDGTALSTGTPNGSGALTVAHTYVYAGSFTQKVYSTTSQDGTLDGAAVVVETTKGVAAVSPVSPVDEVQELAIDATGGTFTVTYAGQATSALAFDASGATVTTAMDALSNLAPGDVVVTGGPGDAGGTTPYVFTFGGTLAATDVAQITASGASLTGGAGTATPSTTTEGVEEVVEVVAVNEVQTLTVTANGGTYTLDYDGEVTTDIAYNAAAATIQTALRALGNIGATDVTVTGSAGGPYTITFLNTLAATDVVLIAAGGDVVDTAVVNVPGKVTAPSGVLAGVTSGNFTFVLSPSTVYTVNWDDLSTSTFTTNGSGTGTAAHTYASAGTYNIEVKDSTGSPVLPNIEYTTTPSFTLDFDGQVTAPLALDAAAATVDAALTALSNIGATDVAVTGNAGGPYTVEFTNTLAATDVETIIATHSNGSTITVEVNTEGDDDPATNEIQIITLP